VLFVCVLVREALEIVDFGEIDAIPLIDASEESKHAFEHGRPGDPLRLSPKLTDRPETTNAVARRLIAGSLGINLPRKKTEEERKLDRLRSEKQKERKNSTDEQ
jgi:hypothetical protein